MSEIPRFSPFPKKKSFFFFRIITNFARRLAGLCCLLCVYVACCLLCGARRVKTHRLEIGEQSRQRGFIHSGSGVSLRVPCWRVVAVRCYCVCCFHHAKASAFCLCVQLPECRIYCPCIMNSISCCCYCRASMCPVDCATNTDRW